MHKMAKRTQIDSKCTIDKSIEFYGSPAKSLSTERLSSKNKVLCEVKFVT